MPKQTQTTEKNLPLAAGLLAAGIALAQAATPSLGAGNDAIAAPMMRKARTMLSHAIQAAEGPREDQADDDEDDEES